MLSFFSSRSSTQEEQDVNDANCVIIEVLSLSNIPLQHDNMKIRLVVFVVEQDNSTTPTTTPSRVSTSAHQIEHNTVRFDETHTFGLDQYTNSETIQLQFQVRDDKRVIAWGQTKNLQAMQTDVDHELQIPLFTINNEKTLMELDVTIRLEGDIGFM
jgi:hypothetical protein